MPGLSTGVAVDFLLGGAGEAMRAAESDEEREDCASESAFLAACILLMSSAIDYCGLAQIRRWRSWGNAYLVRLLQLLKPKLRLFHGSSQFALLLLQFPRLLLALVEGVSELTHCLPNVINLPL